MWYNCFLLLGNNVDHSFSESLTLHPPSQVQQTMSCHLVFVRPTDLFCLQHFQNAFSPGININQIGWYYTFCDLGSLLFVVFFKTMSTISILNFYENDNQFQNSPCCNELKSSSDHLLQSGSMLIFPPETNLKVLQTTTLI